MSNTSRGHTRERKVKKLLEDEGWVVVRAAGSLGPIDLIAMRVDFRPQAIEVKMTAQGPYVHFRLDERDEMREIARRAGADAWLVWWPGGMAIPQWIAESDWPKRKVTNITPRSVTKMDRPR